MATDSAVESTETADPSVDQSALNPSNTGAPSDENEDFRENGNTINPSGAASSTYEPLSPGPASKQPTTAPSSSIFVGTMLAYSFLDSTMPRAPTEDEQRGLMRQTSRFFRDVLAEVYPSLESSRTELVGGLFDASSAFPLLINWNTKGVFTVGK